MPLRIAELTPEALGDEWIRKPFTDADGFSVDWWVGLAVGPLRFFSFFDDLLGEVARAQVKVASDAGERYPTRPFPELEATEIALLEVRKDLRSGGHGIGRAVVAALERMFAPPYLAVSRDASSDGFWRHLGWSEHVHEETEELRAEGAELPSLLFSHP